MGCEGILLAIGNPLLDICAEVDQGFLKKYELEQNNAILADDTPYKSLHADMVARFPVEYVAGGSTQNTARIAQWLLPVPKATTFMGCVGKDEYGSILEQKCQECGLHTCYQYHDTEPTGTCAVLITGNNRSLVANLAAAKCWSTDHLDKPENQAVVAKARYYYCSGYPLTNFPSGMLLVAQHAAENDKMFIMNLSATFLCTDFKEPMLKIMPYVDILFGNESEAAAFSEANQLGVTDIKEIARKIACYPKRNGKRGRIVVITQGSDPTIIIREGKVSEHPVIHIDPKDIVDTNGAGDAFVGGFLAQLVQGGSVEDCVGSANYAANVIIQRSGCSLPDKPTFSVGNP